MKSIKKWRNERKMGEEGIRKFSRVVRLWKWGLVEEEKGKRLEEKKGRRRRKIK